MEEGGPMVCAVLGGCLMILLASQETGEYGKCHVSVSIWSWNFKQE